MSHGPLSVPDLATELGLTTFVEKRFQEQLRQPLAGFALVANKETRAGDWGDEDVSWATLGKMTGVVLSMDIPPIQGDSMSSGKASIEVPIWTKDLVMGGRKWRKLEQAIQRFGMGGVEPTLTQAVADAMAEEINRQILFGSGAGKPGSTTGLLNHTGVQTTAGGDWSDPDVMNTDIGEALATAKGRKVRGTFTLLHNGLDAGVFNTFLNNGGGRRIGENLPSTISRVLEDDTIDQGDAYLVADGPGYYDWLAPQDDPANGFRFGLGAATAGLVDGTGNAPTPPTVQERRDDLMKTRVMRFLNIGTIRPLRTGDNAFTQKITFTVT